MKYASKLYEFFYNPKACFLIPLYQRAYAWEEINCKRLLEDLIKVHRNQLTSHFFGSIVSVKENEVDDDLLIIDGQQRITTVSIIILALKNAVLNKEIACENKEFLGEETNSFLYAKLRKSERNIKLRPIERDREAYDALFTNNPDEFVKDSGITRNYLFFYEQIVRSGLNFEEIFNALEKLIIIDLRLESNDNPQLIFESLNSTGKDLTEADKVRNYMLMSLSKQQQDNFYHKYWIKIEECTDNDPTMFIRDFLTIHLKKICNIDNLYFDFKYYDEINELDREPFLQNLLKYARYYKNIVKGETANDKLNKKLRQLASIGSSVGLPFYMSFFNHAKENAIDDEEVYKVLDITENYWARRIICGYPANVLQKLFSTLHNDILRILKIHEKCNNPLTAPYSELLKYILLRKQGNAIFPSDNELSEFFKTRQIYKLPINYRYFLFERMENENSNEGILPIVKGMKNGIITIEHIMPQTLTPQWKQALGENWQEIHEKYLHAFANLTLSGYNANYSNHPFNEKKEGYIDSKGNQIYGFNDSGYRLSNYLKTCIKWTEKEIQEREKILLEKFIRLWPMIVSDYEPLEKETETISFADDEFELTGRQIAAFTYKGIKHDVTTWKEMVVLLCQIVYEENKSTVIYLSHKKYWFYDENHSDRSRIGEGCYVYSSCSTKTKRSIIKHLFENCEISEFDLDFHLVPLTDKQMEVDEIE